MPVVTTHQLAQPGEQQRMVTQGTNQERGYTKKAQVIPGKTLVQEFTYTQQQLPTHKPIVQYIRQSTTKQLKRNKQSYELQDTDLRRKLTGGYGWPDNKVLELNIPVITDSRIYWPTRTDNDQLNDDFKAAAMFIEDIIKGKLIAGRNRHIQYDISYGGNNHPFGYIVIGIGEEGVDRKHYVIYETHATLIRWLFKRFRELNGNLPLLARELERIDFRFPPFEPGITHHVGLPQAADGSFPLRTREAIIGILTNKAYIGWYEYGGMIVSKEAHDPIVPMDDFLFAYERLSKTNLDGTETQERKPRERRYGATTAFLDGIIHNDDLPVYPMKGTYAARRDINRFSSTVLAVEEDVIDKAFYDVFHSLVCDLRGGARASITQVLDSRYKEQDDKSGEYKEAIARIDVEIRKEEMAQSVSKELGDEQGYRNATRQLVQYRKDREELKQKLDHAGSEANELLEAGDIITKLVAGQTVSLKQLAKVLVRDANMTEASPHFIRLDITFDTPMNKAVSIYIYRANGSRVFWDDDKENYLRNNYANTSAEDITSVLADHSWNSIRVRAKQLGLTRNLPGMNYDALTYSDTALMASTGAKVDQVTWSVVEQDGGAVQD